MGAERCSTRRSSGSTPRFNEAAPRWARRARVMLGIRDSVRVASMRPRHDGRGENGLPAAGGIERGASMRPRHDGRGEAAGLRGPSCGSCRFNEAAPRWARRVLAKLERVEVLIGFNEAAPRWARRGDTPVDYMFNVIFASMRPRHDGRGELTILRQVSRHLTSFNEAAPRWARREVFAQVVKTATEGLQ